MMLIAVEGGHVTRGAGVVQVHTPLNCQRHIDTTPELALNSLNDFWQVNPFSIPF